nr:putative ubiquitin carboxyl-terminal hydrolase 12 [Quercus suber]
MWVSPDASFGDRCQIKPNGTSDVCLCLASGRFNSRRNLQVHLSGHQKIPIGRPRPKEKFLASSASLSEWEGMKSASRATSQVMHAKHSYNRLYLYAGADRGLIKFVRIHASTHNTVGAARARAAHVITASSNKKRKLAPFFTQDGEHIATSSTEDHARSSPTSSPPRSSLASTSDSNSQATSPSTSENFQITPTPSLKLFPPHVQEEVLQSREMNEGGSSPSTAFAEISIDGSGAESKEGYQRTMNSPNRLLGGRSASPAKRSAADMEDVGQDRAADSRQPAPGSFVASQEDGPTNFDTAMAEIPTASNSINTQDTVASNTFTDGDAPSTAPSSFQSFRPLSTSDDDKTSPSTGYTMEALDEQVAKVRAAADAALDVGQMGFVVSTSWLQRVLSRTSEGMKRSDYSKEAREGPIGEMDNTSIVPQEAFAEPILRDVDGREFIPLNPGLTYDEDYVVLPNSIWAEVGKWYDLKSGQRHITRYAQNTAGPDAASSNIQFEMYPPTITIRKVASSSEQTERPRTPPRTSADEPRRRQERLGYGQTSPDDVIRLVSSRTERFQKFLARCKAAAGIARTTKVKLWRQLDTETIMTESSNSIASVSGRARQTMGRLSLTPAEFKQLDIGKDIEHIDAPDHTNNDNYNGKSTMDTFGLFKDQTIVLEEQIGSGDFQSDSMKRVMNNDKKPGSKPSSALVSGRTSPPNGMVTRGRVRRDGRTRGTVGLTNLGNTCYMNSALQCIRSVEELAIYFLSDRYKAEINNDNPLGHHGAMAKAYATVLAGIYNGSTGSAFTPQQFKKTLGNAQPLFSGYGQQDSQEFLSFLVDALHEDLNRVLKKPYNENPDSDDNTVHDPQAIIDLGEIYRRNHRARNDSIAMDLFSGFYKNTMECPVCDKVSINFDPFSLITVQLPIDSTWQHRVTFIPLNGEPINHAVDIDKNSTIKTLKAYIASKHPGVSADRMWMAEVYSHKIYRVFDDKASIGEAGIQSGDHVFLWELTSAPTNVPSPKKSTGYYPVSKVEQTPDMDSPRADNIAVPVFSRKKKQGYGWDNHFHPMYITVTRDEARDYATVFKKVLVAVSQMTSVPIMRKLADPSKLIPVNEHKAQNGIAKHAETRVLDRSASSEDSYVEVTITAADADDGDAMDLSTPNDCREPPPDFMDPTYSLPEAVFDSMFHMRYAKSADGPYCASMSSYESTVHDMFTRVKLPSRRSSIASASSLGSVVDFDEGKITVEPLDSDTLTEADDDMLKPDVVIGNEDSLSLPGSDEEDTDAQSTLPESRIEDMSRKTNGNPNKFKTKRRSKKGKPAKQSSQRTKFGAPRQPSGKAFTNDDNPYFIKTGEAIILDWNPDAMDSLFFGKPDDEEDQRGHWTSADDGKGLEFVDDPEVVAKQKTREARKKNGVTLEDCFAETGKREILSQDNAWYCGRCKDMRQAAKTLEIWTIPEILIVHLKRFGGNRSFRDKIDVNVRYPLTGLDMTDKIGLKEDGKEYLYDLIAVDNHFGGLGGGHYTAMVKNFYDGQWYDCNGECFHPCSYSPNANHDPDSTCSKLSDTRLQSAAAYLLFYRRRSDKPLGPPALQELVLQSRKPSPAESGNEGAEEDESGEGRLGGPNSSLHWSPSASGAGAVAENSRNIAGGIGASVDHHPNPSQMTTLQNESREPAFIGPQRPPVYALTDSQPSWSFESLMDNPADAITEPNSSDGNDSNEAIIGDNDSAYGGDEDMMMKEGLDNDDFPSAGRSTPLDYDVAGTEQLDDEVRVEEASMQPDLPATEIRLDSEHDVESEP